MLIEFTVGNFLSFYEPKIFSMNSSKSVKEHFDKNTFIDSTEKFRLLKVASIYGANASGKSNLIKSLLFTRDFIVNSFNEALLENNERSFSYEKFLLNPEAESKPSLFEIVFSDNKKRYRYGFELDNNKIISEWLFVVNSTKELPLFTRINSEIEFNQRSFKEGKGLVKKTRENVLFLSVVAQFDGIISKIIIDWFKKLKTISALNDLGYRNYTINKLRKDEKFKIWVNEFIKFLDIGELSTEKYQPELLGENEIPKDEDFKNLVHLMKKIQKRNNRESEKIITMHKSYDDNNNFIKTVAFDLETQESEGTKKLINMLGPLYDTLQNGLILVVDELDSRFHSLLTIKIIEFFLQKDNKNAQLIFTSHDTNLLKKEIFRRDQIFFTEKNNKGVTDLYSMVEYKEHHVRKDATFDKNYLIGKYGAIPMFGNINSILNLIYE